MLLFKNGVFVIFVVDWKFISHMWLCFGFGNLL